MLKQIFFVCITSIIIKVVNSQCLRPPPYNLMNRPFTEFIETPRIIESPRIVETPRIIESPRLYEAPRIIEGPRIVEAPRMVESPRILDAARRINPSPTIITEPPCNSVVPIPNMPSSTTIITDCTPAVCKNLANTIQLMIVCNLLQNYRGGPEIAMQLASPILNEVLTSPALSCGCSNPIAPLAAGIAPNLLSPGLLSPNMGPQVISPSVIPGIPNSPLSNVQSTNNILNSLMSLLGGVL